MPPRTRGLTQADLDAWANYARMIAPLRPGPPAKPPFPGRPPPPALPPPLVSVPVVASARPEPGPRMFEASPAATLRSPRASIPALSVGGQPGGLDKATWQRLRSGKLVTERRLDLHGMTVQHAFHALVSFLRSAHADRVRCVEIITGRGATAGGTAGRGTGRGASDGGMTESGGVIRRELPHWLNLPEIRPLVLGAAHPHALNPGSVRVLLRRAR